MTDDLLTEWGAGRGTSIDDPSGARRAQEAHDAGAVVQPVEVPMHSVWLEFRVHGSESFTRELATAVAEALLEHPEVVGPVAQTVTGLQVGE